MGSTEAKPGPDRLVSAEPKGWLLEGSLSVRENFKQRGK